MTELERFTSAVLDRWHREGGGGALTVGALLDKVFPYPVARRALGIDVSEDYEMLVLRLVAEEEGVSETTPSEAAQMARKTLGDKLPDLDVLRVLRSATLAPIEAMEDRVVKVLNQAAEPPEPAPAPVPQPPPPPPSKPTPPPVAIEAARCWNCPEALPTGRVVRFCPFCGADQRPPTCPECHVEVERGWRHCPDCGHRLGGEGTPG